MIARLAEDPDLAPVPPMIRLFRATDAPLLADLERAELVLAVDRRSREVVAFAGPVARPGKRARRILRVEVDVRAGDLDRLAALLLSVLPTEMCQTGFRP